MTVAEYIALPEMEPKVVKIGEKFRWARTAEREPHVGESIIYFEVIRVTDRGYEAMQMETVLE